MPFSSPCNTTLDGVTVSSCCCNNGFNFDDFGECVKTCTKAQYYDYGTGSCIACAKNALTCDVNGVLTCVAGYTLDFFNNVCYKCRSRGQYYNPITAACTNCPSGSTCCTYENDFLSICACRRGFELDEFNQVCYSCSSL